MKQKPPPRYFEPLAELAGLIDAMPVVMPPHDVKPLALGIGKEWRAWVQAHAIDPKAPTLARCGRWFIWRLINSFDYKQAILANDHRYDLEGNIAGVVTAEEKAHAQQWLDTALANIAAREAAS